MSAEREFRDVTASNALARNKLNEIALKASETQGNAYQRKPNMEGTNSENENKTTPSKEHQASVTNVDILWKRTDWANVSSLTFYVLPQWSAMAAPSLVHSETASWHCQLHDSSSKTRMVERIQRQMNDRRIFKKLFLSNGKKFVTAGLKIKKVKLKNTTRWWHRAFAQTAHMGAADCSGHSERSTKAMALSFSITLNLGLSNCLWFVEERMDPSGKYLAAQLTYLAEKTHLEGDYYSFLLASAAK